MHFPVYIHIGSWVLPPHPILESLAYFVGARIYFYMRARSHHSTRYIPADQGLWIVVGAVLGAAAGSKVLSWLEDPWLVLQHLSDPHYWMGGQTIVGGLLGGLIGVEFAKRRVGVTESTGDDFVWPLIIGMCIGRVGCFLAGLPDDTYGTPTHWFTGVDFGDGIPRHPTQLYEIAFLLVWGAFIWWVDRRDPIRFYRHHVAPSLPQGAKFQLFMFGYLVFRLLVEFIKPTPHIYFGLSNIQLACIGGIAYYTIKIGTWLRRNATPMPEAEYAE